MPTIAEIFGYYVRMFYGDHNPPHIHIYKKKECVAIVNIKTLETAESKLNPKQENNIKNWVNNNQDKLLKIWNEYQI
ncbi:DUF4160 domain-containing protein [Francisella tularensis]|uniref:DUF4160 domain-containing protein n=1 Tax=Francisella tularensis TaxID=263 RepID=UPI0008F502F5|nr:DUF4160 domain-containing protein [Francisella tularensis]APA83251.1 hypothetical protein N894_1267 [Francisella tularensis subsp. novicida PA10-7858]